MTEPTIDQILAMSPAEAGAALAGMTAQFQATESHPTARIEQLSNDPAFVARLTAGDVDANKEFNSLVAAKAAEPQADKLGRILAGTAALPLIETVTDGELSTHNTMTAVEDLRKLGLNDAQVREAFAGATNSAEVLAQARQLYNARMTDHEWTAKLMSGDFATKREHTLLCVVLSSEAGP